MNTKSDNKTPVLILGGEENALSTARSLGRKGIPVDISTNYECGVSHSRYCRKKYPFSADVNIREFWKKLLLGDKNPELRGSMLFACSDDAVQFLSYHRDELIKIYLLDDFDAQLHLHMLDKQKTLELAKLAGCSIPNYWNIETADDVRRAKTSISFPTMIKPIHSHEFKKNFQGQRYFLVNDFEYLLEKSILLFELDIKFMICEIIPGPDDLLCSYFTYHDKNQRPLFHFTKRCIRRCPINSGSGTYQITEWIPKTAEEGMKFFNGINYKGMGHIEFKLDTRDGKLKVIECNPRFSAAQEVVARSGMDMAYIIYQHLTGHNVPTVTKFKDFVRIISPLRDYKAYLQLRVKGELNFWGWFKSTAHKQVFAYFDITDILPFIVKFLYEVKQAIAKRLKFS